MATLKRILLLTVTLLFAGVMAAVGAYLLLDDATLVGLLIRNLESATDTHIDYAQNASVSRTHAPVLRLHKLVIEDAGERYRAETDSLLLEISLPGLLLGQLAIQRLWLGDTRIDVRKASDEEQSSLAEDLQALPDLLDLPLRPRVRDVQITGISVRHGEQEWVLPPSRLGNIALQVEPATGSVELSARLEAGRDALQLHARLSDLQGVEVHRQIPFSIGARGSMLDAALTGQVEMTRPAPLVQGQLEVHLANLDRFSANNKLVIPGAATARAELTGTLAEPVLEQLSVRWTAPGHSSVRLDGRIGEIAEVRDIQLSLTGHLGRPEWLAPVLPDSLGSLDRVKLSAQLSGDRSRLMLENVSLEARTADELDLALTGRFDLTDLLGNPATEDLEAKLVFSSPTTHAARALLFTAIPEFGAIEGSTEIRSTRGDPALENTVVKARDPQGIRVDLSGRIAEFPLHPDRPNKGYELAVRMQSTKTSVLAKRIGVDLPISGPLDLNYRIEGDTRALQLNQIGLSAGDKAGELLEAKGSIRFREWEQTDPLQSLDLVLDYRARDTGILDAWVQQELPPLAYKARARLHTVSGQHRIDDFRLSSIPGEPLTVQDTGYAEHIRFLPEFAIEGIHLQSHISTDNVATLNTYLGLENTIPPIGPFDLRATVTGTNRRLLIDDVRLTAGEASILRVEATGRLGQISAEKKWQIENADLAVKGGSSSSQSLAKALGYRLPELGPVQLSASIHDRDKQLGIKDIRLHIGNATPPVLQSDGKIGNLYSLADIHLDTTLHLRGRMFSAFADLHELPELGDLTGRMEISDRDGSAGIDTLHIQSTANELFNLSLDGSFTDFNNPETLAFDVTLGARDMQLLGALLDRDWPDHGRVELSGTLTRVEKKPRFTADLVAGRQRVGIELNTILDSTPPHVTGKISAANFFLPDLFERERKQREKRREAGEAPPKEKPPLFSRTPLDIEPLKSVDLDLEIDIESFDRTMSAAESARAKISLKSGQLSVRPAVLVYPKGKADLDLQLVAGETLRVSFSFQGENLDPWRGLNIFETDSEGIYQAGNAELDVKISLNSVGASPHELAANLDGSLYAAIRDGKITQSKLRLLFIDIIGWVSNLEKRRYADVNCGVADFIIKQGIVDTSAFFLDMKDITIAGKGTIDLAEEQIDYVFIPRKKSRLIVKSEPVDVKGPLNDPQITAIPVKSAAAKIGTLGTLLFAPYVFAGILAGEYASGELQDRGDDASVCLEYLKKRQDEHEEN